MTIASRIAGYLGHLFSSDASRSEVGPTILLYHRIGEDRFDPWAMTISADNFAAQMEWPAKHRSVLPLVDFAEAHRRNMLPTDAVAITFDDGYACNALIAAPILKETGIPATVFLAAEPIERGGEFWWDELQRIVMDFPGDRLNLAGKKVELGDQSQDDSNWLPGSQPRTARQRAFMAIWSRLQLAAVEDRDTWMGELREQASQSNSLDPLKRPMTAAEARSASSILDIGSHALTHSSLPSLSSSAKVREIQESRSRVEALADVRPTCFAYPFGDADSECEYLVGEAGFTCACVTGERAVRLLKLDVSSSDHINFTVTTQAKSSVGLDAVESAGDLFVCARMDREMGSHRMGASEPCLRERFGRRATPKREHSSNASRKQRRKGLRQERAVEGRRVPALQLGSR